MFANIHSHKKPLIHIDIICDPFPGRFIGASSFVYGKQKFAKCCGSASLNICFRSDILKLFIYLYAFQSSTQETETAPHDTHVNSGSENLAYKRQILQVKDQEKHNRSKQMYGEFPKRGATFSNKPSHDQSSP